MSDDNVSLVAWNFFKRGQSLDFLRAMESCSIQIADLDKLMGKFQRQARILDTLEGAPEGLLEKLKSFKICLSFARIPLFDKIFDPGHRAWSIAKHLLGPSVAPSLKTLSITTAWLAAYDPRIEADHDEIVNKISSQCLEMLERCGPVWEDDVRSVEKVFSLREPCYFPISTS